MSRTDFDMEVSGLKEMVTGLRTLQGPELPKVIEASAGRTMRAVVVPAMRRQMSADFKDKGSHREPKKADGSGERAKPRPGRSGPAERNVTVRKLRKRSGEIVALKAGPRAWYAHFPIAGTKAHVIRARGAFGEATSSDVRKINRLARGEYRFTTRDLQGGKVSKAYMRALVINGLYRQQVSHPGSRGTNSIQKAVQGVTPQLNARYAGDLQAAYEKHLAGPTRRARPR